jgi:hypothetical protein
MNITTRIKKLEKKIENRNAVNDRCIPIVEVSEETREKYKRLGLPIPIVGDLKAE